MRRPLPLRVAVVAAILVAACVSTRPASVSGDAKLPGREAPVAGESMPPGRHAPVAGESMLPGRLAAWAPLDGFENPAWPDPGLWRLPDEPSLTWWPSSCQARTGQRGLRAFGGGRGTVELPCDAAVEAGTSSTITMRLDLRETELASRIELFFDLWLRMPPGTDQGLFIHLLMPQEDEGVESIPVFGATSMSGEWAFPPRKLDLLNLTNIEDPGQPIDLRGGIWYLVWTAYAPNGAPAGGGVFIDNVSLVWEPGPAVATPTPWHTATPTATQTPSPTRRPTSTSTPSPTPSPITAYVPRVYKDLPPTPTPTPITLYVPKVYKEPPPTPMPTATEPSPEPSPTHDVTGTVTAEPGETGTPGPGETGTPSPDVTRTPPMTATIEPTATATAAATATATRTPPVVETLPPRPTLTVTPTVMRLEWGAMGAARQSQHSLGAGGSSE